MISLKRTDSEDNDFMQLVTLLDADLRVRDGDEHAFYAQFNKIDQIRHVIVAYRDEKPVGCGAIKPYDASTMEIKRMFVLPELRGAGIASEVLNALERWAAELGYEKCILETGVKQPEAIALYTKNSYDRIPNYGQYKEAENSVCFEKPLKLPG
ncbi:GNAT family N-acetyltransferase [Prolixibacter denitrificans]|uniref:Acetyltransferase (GNAT) family protein n=1 Tax=Prolixibacter denitrificans TaxID=1541063 RepID=A0A2P8CAE3_9BACT|nr:GNAT family N-acetyltransferase [Prolixibacter denitrificans]PSK81931.1 acetyltransferase (GNAT) family protein [Prolixibacter denitrificans]GET22528.1 N-acetyltransferase [Prolixibacter denitrificans]